MGDKTNNGMTKPVYYQLSDLTAEELTRYYKFNSPLNNKQLDIVKEWYRQNTKNFALIDEDYIFFTLKSEHDAFVKFWSAYNQVEFDIKMKY